MLKAENLVLHVEDNGTKKCLLDHISFQVDDGEMLVITGPNGGGKSTLAKVLIGIETAESGKIFLNGEDITDYDINHRANAGIGYAFQQPPRFKGMTVQRLLALAAGREMSDVECCLMEIMECEILADGTRRYRPLFQYQITENRVEDGKFVIVGHHRQINPISDSLARRLMENGMPQETLAGLLNVKKDREGENG